MMIRRLPHPALRPFIKVIWASAGAGEPRSVGIARERVLPTGTMHLVFRLSEHPLRVFDDEADLIGRTIGCAVVGGARSESYIRDVSKPVGSVGAQFWPGAAPLLIGVPADELSNRHTDLEDIWGRSASNAREHIAEAGPIERQLDAFEALLVTWLPRVRGLHPAIASALERFATSAGVSEVVKESEISHRRFIGLFRHAVGLTPKLYCRVLRFQEALQHISAGSAASWVDIALTAGYSDQPHFSREFLEFAGLSPRQYHARSPHWANHVPLLHSGVAGARPR